MKKLLVAAGSLLAFAGLSQNEWNSTTNSTAPMFRNGNVGIGTNAVTGLPFVVNNPTPGLGTHVSFGHNAVIGSYGANATLVQMASPTVNDGMWMHMAAGISSTRSELIIAVTNASCGFYSGKGPTGTTQPFVFYTNGSAGTTEKMRIQVDGKVGIGMPASYPGTYKLYVKDGILTEKVKVAVDGTANWSDYVFAPEYKLKTVEEVAAFIKQNKHLPGMPSAEEVVKDGLDVATMDAKLLEKIEEMMLYIIDLKQEVTQLKKENSALKSTSK